MNFKPSDEKRQSKLLPGGEYEYLIVKAEEKKSARGNPMIEVALKVSGNGETKTITDYLVASRKAKLRSAAYSCGLGDKFETGVLNDIDFANRRGRLLLGIESSEEYPDKNVVVEYLTAHQRALPAPDISSIVARYARK